jgi:hypothetical protein
MANPTPRSRARLRDLLALRPALLPAFVLALLLAPAAGALQIAAWSFDGGSLADISGNAPAYDLTAVNGGADLSGGFARFSGIEAAGAYLEVAGPGGMPDWTLSIWVRSQGQIDQGSFQGIFSNNTSSTANWSWQLESFGGVYQWRNQAGTFVVGAPSALGTWDHIVLRKFGGNDGDIWMNGAQVLASLGGNPGGLQNFRLGTNRNTTQHWQGDVDEVEVHDSQEDPVALFNQGAPLPEPSGLALLGALAAAGAALQLGRLR